MGWQFGDFAGFYGFKPILHRPYRGRQMTATALAHRKKLLDEKR